MVFTSCAVAFAHGSNDVANAIGPLAAIHQATNQILGNAVSPDTPLWILFLGAAGIVIGLATLGYRVMKTIGEKIVKLTPSKGFAAQLAAALTVVLASQLDMPVSTTHTLVGAVIGIVHIQMGSVNVAARSGNRSNPEFLARRTSYPISKLRQTLLPNMLEPTRCTQ